MNFDDEISAAGNAAIPGLAGLENFTGMGDAPQQSMYGDKSKGFWDTFKQNLANYQQERKNDDIVNPKASAFGRITGVLSTLPMAERAAVAKLPEVVQGFMKAHPIATAAGEGSIFGGFSGAGAGDGNRGQSAALGLLTGGALGAGIGSAVEAAPAIAGYVKLLFNKGQVATSRALSQITEALHRDGYDVTNPSNIAALKQAIQEWTGKPVMLADIGGAVRARTGVGLRAPSDQQIPALDRIESRFQGAGPRIASDIRANVAPRTDVHALDEQLVEQRAQEAAKLRDAALFEDAPVTPPTPRPVVQPRPDAPDAGVRRTLGEDVPETYQQVPAPAPAETLPTAQPTGRQSRIVDDPQLQQLARLPMAQKALSAAMDQAEAERGLLASTGQSIDHLPDLNRGSQLDMRSFDYIKRFLDDEVTRLYKRGDTSTFSAAQAGQVKALRNAIRDRLKEYNPAYKDYLNQYAGSSDMIDSLEAGRTFDNLDPEQIASEQGKRSDAAQELYRIGAARRLLDKIRDTKDTAAPAGKILNSDESRAQLEATGVNPSNMARLNRSLSQERTMDLLKRETQGSGTQQRQMAQQDASSAASLHLPWNPASKFSWAGALIRGAIDKLSTARNAQVNEALLPRLTSSDPAAIDRTIAELEAHGHKAEANAIRRAFRGRQGAALLGTIIGGPVALPKEQ
jgi:hypothetical protein